MFAFDFRVSPPTVVMTPFIGMDLEDAFVVAGSFTELLQRMQAATGSLLAPSPTGRGPSNGH